jgi:demethylmenaquinone methyltransferase / 2-methoxy-6-polyprenyl-1,4-benzoquinol methylase
MASKHDPPMTMPASPRTRHAVRLFSGLGHRYDRMGALLSFGQDRRWRRFLVSRLPEGSAVVLDVATGTGLVARELRQTRRADRVVAIDQSEPMLRAGSFDPSTDLVLARAERLPFADAAFDGLTVTYLLRYVDDPAETLRELARVLRPGGVVASLEFGVPPEPLWDGAWWLYTRVAMPAIGAVVSRDWYRVGRFLGPSIDAFWRAYPLAAQLEMWRAAGFGSVRWHRMSLGGGIVFWAVRER